MPLNSSKIRIGWCIIPPSILSRTDISNTQKILWGRINGLINDQDFCYASNHYLGEQIGIHKLNISRALTDLETKQLLTIEFHEIGTKKERRIYLLNGAQGIDENVKGVLTKTSRGGCRKRQGGIDENVKVYRENAFSKEREEKESQVKTSDNASRLSELLFQEILKNNSMVRLHNLTETQRAQTIERWAKDIDLLIRKDRQEPSIVEEVIRYCTADSFWGSNILSGKKLREKWDTLSAQMQKRSVSNPEESRSKTQAAEGSDAVMDPATGNPAKVLQVRKTRMSVREEFKAGLLK